MAEIANKDRQKVAENIKEPSPTPDDYPKENLNSLLKDIESGSLAVVLVDFLLTLQVTFCITLAIYLPRYSDYYVIWMCLTVFVASYAFQHSIWLGVKGRTVGRLKLWISVAQGTTILGFVAFFLANILQGSTCSTCPKLFFSKPWPRFGGIPLLCVAALGAIWSIFRLYFVSVVKSHVTNLEAGKLESNCLDQAEKANCDGQKKEEVQQTDRLKSSSIKFVISLAIVMPLHVLVLSFYLAGGKFNTMKLF